MHRTPVSSSNILSLGWDHGVLEVEFHQGHVYRFYDVPYDSYDRLIYPEDGSVGRAFKAHIEGRFRYERISSSARGKGKR